MLHYKIPYDYQIFLEDNNLLILILIALGICLAMDAEWLELTDLLNGF